MNEKHVTEKGKEALVKNNELMEMFLKSSENNIHLKEEEKKNILYYVLVNKTANIRWADEMRAVRESCTTRGSKANKTGQEFRQSLKGMKGKSSKIE